MATEPARRHGEITLSKLAVRTRHSREPAVGRQQEPLGSQLALQTAIAAHVADRRKAIVFGTVLTALLASGSPATSCPLAELTRAAIEPITSLRHEERPLTPRQSSEGGKWDIYLRSDGALHSLVRTDFGETGQRQRRASFLTKDDFVIVSTTVHYRTPIGSGNPGTIASSESTEYFYCKDVVFIPASLGDESSARRSLSEAGRLKSDILESADVSPYLNRIK